MSKQTIQPLNLIVVSPGDVQPEREAMDAVVADLNRIISSQFGLELRVLRPQIMVYFRNKKYECKNDAEKQQLAQVEAYKKKVSADALWWGT
jgi:hypothetical protein